MHAPLHLRSLALIGLSGTGKTTLAPLLAEQLEQKLYDTDELIVEAAGVSIPTIFATQGETAFRAMEEGALAFALFDGPSIIATGGGTILSENNRAMLLRKAFVVWLDAPDAILLARLQAANDSRPLLDDDPAVRLAELRAIRGPLYAAAANMTLDTTELDPAASVAAIIAGYRAALEATQETQ